MDNKYYEYLNNIIDNDGLVSDVNYNFSESPSTQQYHSVAAQNNPDYAQAIGDIYRWGDVNRAKFNMDLGLTSALNRKKYLEKTRDEQRAYAEKLADKKFQQQKELQMMKLNSLFSRAKLNNPNNNKKVSSTGYYVNDKDEIIGKPEDYKYNIAAELEKMDLPIAKNFYKTEGFSGIEPSTFDLTELKNKNAQLNKTREDLLNPGTYIGTSEPETRYILNKLVQNYINDVNKFNNQQDLYNKSVNKTVDRNSGKNFISNKLAELNNSNDYASDINTFNNAILQDFVNETGSQIPTEGWDSSPELQQIYLYLLNNNIDLSNKYPIQNGDELYLYDVANGTIDAINTDETNNVTLDNIYNAKDYRKNYMSNMLKPFVSKMKLPVLIDNKQGSAIQHDMNLEQLGDYLYNEKAKNF